MLENKKFLWWFWKQFSLTVESPITNILQSYCHNWVHNCYLYNLQLSFYFSFYLHRKLKLFVIFVNKKSDIKTSCYYITRLFNIILFLIQFLSTKLLDNNFIMFDLFLLNFILINKFYTFYEHYIKIRIFFKFSYKFICFHWNDDVSKSKYLRLFIYICSLIEELYILLRLQSCGTKIQLRSKLFCVKFNYCVKMFRMNTYNYMKLFALKNFFICNAHERLPQGKPLSSIVIDLVPSNKFSKIANCSKRYYCACNRNLHKAVCAQTTMIDMALFSTMAFA